MLQIMPFVVLGIVAMTLIQSVPVAPDNAGVEHQTYASTCELVNRAQSVHQQLVKVHARYSGTWEGYYLSGAKCGEAEPISTELHLRDSTSQREEFERAVSELCNGHVPCKFDYIDADFIGHLSVKKDFRIKDGFGNGFGQMGRSRMRFDVFSVLNVKPHSPNRTSGAP